MRRQSPTRPVALLALLATLVGCTPQQPVYLHGQGDLSHYLGYASTIDKPDLPEPPFSELDSSIRPFSLGGPQPKDYWELKLEEAVRIALQNARVMRNIGGQVQGPPTALTGNQQLAPTIYDPAITETDARFGIQAGLSLFDATWSNSIFWEKNHEPRNVDPNFGGVLPNELQQDAFSYTTAISKTNPNGTTLTVSNSSAYDLEPNTTTRLFPGAWTTTFQMEVRQPLLQGAGVEFNEIAGPGAIPGFNQGVLIARVNTDISLATFEASVRNMVSDVESIYWELYYDYRNLDAAVQGRDSALRTWQRVYSLYIHGGTGGEASSEAQAREQYFLFRSTAEQALAQLFQTESKLRYMLGIAATDGRLIRPADDPTTAKVVFDWTQIQTEAMCRSVEIREARFRIKQRELELIAAKNYLLPRLDAVAYYRWLGLGQKLIENGGGENFGGAFENLGTGAYQDWHLGLEMSIPIGYRKQMSGVTNAELTLARDRAKLREIELEVSHQVAFALRDMDANLVLSASNFNRRAAAQRNVEAVQKSYETGKIGIDVLLSAQRDLAQAESDYYRVLTNYARSISQVHLRKGSLLEYNGVYLTEGPWPGKAYFDARRRARARDAARYLDYGSTRPLPISAGPIQQSSGEPQTAEETPVVNETAPAKPKETDHEPESNPVPPLPKPKAPAEPAPRRLPSPPGINAQKKGPSDERTSKHTVKSRDLASLNLAPLASSPSAKQTGTPIRDSNVQQSGFHDAYELGKDLPLAEDHRPASGR